MSKSNELSFGSPNHQPELDPKHTHEATHVYNQPGADCQDAHSGHNHGALGAHVHVAGAKLKWAFFATFFILAVEVVGGGVANSLALLSDAGHVLTDVAALGLAWFAAVQAQKSPTLSKTFGYHRTGILAALANSLTLIIIAFVILYEAIRRFQNPQSVESTIMCLSAGVGLIVNLAIAFSLRGGEDNLNVRSALLHVLGDAAASAGVISGAVIMQFTSWYVIDPIISVLIALMIAWNAWKIVKVTIHILMEGAPTSFEYDRLLAYVRILPGAKDIHDLHVWSMTPERVALSCHLVVDPEGSLERSTEIIKQLKQYLLEEFGISHTTIEVEIAQCGCTALLCNETLWKKH
ncbi:Cation diffusion facilitator family transporter [Candidatus Desulfosporosinus infrequens]|uniref:Cation diffusion facilitator family transporter n=1 Tax=Candidatus Desulfosporosinus infrequens TaxID=2043169 RepID=A0A2U3KQX3_9FIRM|nr:Cation diffusion facilitator family transporter [Candidatus Desulfosporosinus infrequens]